MYGAVAQDALVTRQSAQVQVPCAPTRGPIVDPDQADVDLAGDIPPVLDPPQTSAQPVPYGRGSRQDRRAAGRPGEPTSLVVTVAAAVSLPPARASLEQHEGGERQQRQPDHRRFWGSTAVGQHHGIPASAHVDSSNDRPPTVKATITATSGSCPLVACSGVVRTARSCASTTPRTCPSTIAPTWT